MHIVFLKFSANKEQAAQSMEDHRAWLQQGFEDGVFLLAGSLEAGMGGGILAHNVSTADLQKRVNQDPFVVKNVVTPEIYEIDPGKADKRLQFLVS